MNPIKAKRKWFLVGAVTAAVVLLVNFAPKFVYLNTTRSLPLGLYLAIPGRNLRVGDIVVYEPPENVQQLVRERSYGGAGAGRLTFLKHVGALPGDVYEVEDGAVRVNGETKGSIKEVDNEGNPMPVMTGLHVVREGEFLPLGEVPNSLDGRYTGTVPVDNIITRVVPVLTEW